MKKAPRFLTAALAALFLASAAPLAAAAPRSAQEPVVEQRNVSVWHRNQRIPNGNRTEGVRGQRGQRWRNRTFGAPEIDPGLLSGGLALLIGGTLVLLGQRRSGRRQPERS